MLFISLQICRFCQERLSVCCQQLICPFQALPRDLQLLFIHLKGQIAKTHLKFLQVPFHKSKQIYKCTFCTFLVYWIFPIGNLQNFYFKESVY